MRTAVFGATGRAGWPPVEPAFERAIAGGGDPIDAVVSVLGQPSEGPEDRCVNETPRAKDA